MWWVDLIIVLLLAYGGWEGYRRGFAVVAVDLVGFVLAAVIASLAYAKAGVWLAKAIGLIPSLAAVAAYLFILLLIEIIYVIAVRRLLQRVPRHWLSSPLNRWTGVVINIIRVGLIAAIGLVIFTALPFSTEQKELVTKANLPRLLLGYSGQLQRGVNSLIGSAVTDSLNFITVKPESSETITLGFTTTDVRVNEPAEAAMLVLVNKERTSRGLKALRLNETARAVARKHSRDMFALGYFSHVNTEGKSPFQRMEAGGVKYLAAGENLALAPTLQLAHTGLMNSPGHKANILSPDYGTVGIGIIDGGRYGLMVTQNFTD